jgi:hypothetical protein
MLGRPRVFQDWERLAIMPKYRRLAIEAQENRCANSQVLTTHSALKDSYR